MSCRRSTQVNMYDYDDRERLLNSSASHSFKHRLTLPIRQIPTRIVQSFVPPLSTAYVHTDLLCPLLAVVALYLTLLYASSCKIPVAHSSTSVEQTLILYVLLVVPVFYAVQPRFDLYETCAVLGYGLFGHVATLLLCLLSPGNVTFYFISLIFFGGLNILRLIILLLFCMRYRNIIKLLVCSYLCVVYLMCNIYVYFRYVRRT